MYPNIHQTLKRSWKEPTRLINILNKVALEKNTAVSMRFLVFACMQIFHITILMTSLVFQMVAKDAAVSQNL